MNKFRYLFLVIAIVFQPSLMAVKKEPAIDKLFQFQSKTQTLSAHFVQNVYDESGETIDKAQGEVWLQRPNKFRWNYALPDPQQIVADGTYIWMYDEGLEQVTKRKLDSTLSVTPAVILAGEKPLAELFILQQIEGRRDGLDWVALSPRSEEATFNIIYLGFGEDFLQNMELRDNLGQRTVIQFSKMKTNESLDKNVFEFEPPKNVDIIVD